MNITLIGYRGTGKSTIGRALAHHLAMAFVDADALLVEHAGKTIKQIFTDEGEAGFRDRESAIIRALSTRTNTIIAAGGGVVLRRENVIALKAHSKIIWLHADAATLHARTVADTASALTRPNLTTTGGFAEVETMLSLREPLYRAAADHTLDVAALSVQQAVDALARHFRQA